MRRWLMSLAALGLVALAVLLPERLSDLNDKRLLDKLQITSQEQREGFAKSTQLSVAEKLLMLRGGSMEVLKLDDNPAELVEQRYSLAGGAVITTNTLDRNGGGGHESALSGGSGKETQDNAYSDEYKTEEELQEAVEEIAQKWSKRLTNIHREIRTLQNIGGLPILWSGADTVECTNREEYIVIDPATQVNFGIFRVTLSCSPYSLMLWADSQTGRILSLNLIWNGNNLLWNPTGVSAFGGAWRSYWEMDSVEGSWYLRTHDILETTSNMSRMNSDYSAGGRVTFTYDEVEFISALECFGSSRGGYFLLWNHGIL